MKKKVSLLSVIVVFCFCARSTSIADLFTVQDDLADNQLITQGNSISGTFDINPVLPTNGQYVLPYDVTDAAYTFTFHDDGDPVYTGDTYYSPSSYYYYSGYYNGRYVYYRYAYNYYRDEFEQIQVDVEGEYSYNHTDWVSQPVQSYAGYSYSMNSYAIWYTYGYNREYGYMGDMTITQHLGQYALDSLSDNGIIDFTLTATYGDIIYTGGELTVDIDTNPVPTPSAFLLGGIGLGVAHRRLRRRKTA